MEQGIADTPMQHEGINRKRHERKAFNQQVKNYRKSKAGYKNMQEKVVNRGHLDSLSKHFSFNEKKNGQRVKPRTENLYQFGELR